MTTDILTGKNVFISGATGGIGSAIADSLAKTKCNIFLTGSNMEKLESIAASLQKYGVDVQYGRGDLRKSEDIYSLIEQARTRMSRIDILVNAAGVFPNGLLLECQDADFDEAISVNLKAPFLFSKYFAADMVSSKWGRIINIGSSSAYTGFKGTSIYCATKHALLGLSRSLQDELKQHNVRTYCISPSSTKTAMALGTPNQDYSTFLDPEDIAEYVTFVIAFDSQIISDEIQLRRM